MTAALEHSRRVEIKLGSWNPKYTGNLKISGGGVGLNTHSRTYGRFIGTDIPAVETCCCVCVTWVAQSQR